jgi:hypothetical protein
MQHSRIPDILHFIDTATSTTIIDISGIVPDGGELCDDFHSSTPLTESFYI